MFCVHYMKGGEIMPRETSSRKYQLTINNPLDYGLSHEQIIKNLETLTIEYWCLCDEIGIEENTPHTHIFIYSKNPIMFSTIKKRFYQAHIEKAQGTCQQNRDYIRKEGKYLDSDKKETNLSETFKEFGIMPIERVPTKNISEQVLEMIKDGKSNLEIVEAFPSFITKFTHLDKARQIYKEKQYSQEFRDLEVTYIYGETETGKTRFVMDNYGYQNVYKVSNYAHPFDSYEGQDVILFDEFRSSLPLKEMLQYLDGYPLKLPARYNDRQACYTKVFLISNIPFEKQYVFVQNEEPKSFQAFRRRFTKFLNFIPKDQNIPYYDKNNIDIIESWE